MNAEELWEDAHEILDAFESAPGVPLTVAVHRRQHSFTADDDTLVILELSEIETFVLVLEWYGFESAVQYLRPATGDF